ncbi:MAG TPA: hypothetical protein VFN61_09230 [Acidimicrobiales bacterium]|nr:hypothetical protein [Acidimicrobiales bacterium]
MPLVQFAEKPEVRASAAVPHGLPVITSNRIPEQLTVKSLQLQPPWQARSGLARCGQLCGQPSCLIKRFADEIRVDAALANH